MIPIKPVSMHSSAVPNTKSAPDLSHIPLDVAGKFLAPGKLNLTALPPLALYIHFPWCVKSAPIAISIRMKSKELLMKMVIYALCVRIWNHHCRLSGVEKFIQCLSVVAHQVLCLQLDWIG